MITPSFSLTATERVLPKLALDFTTASLDSRITFTRALNTATRVNSSGYIETVNANVARFDYNPVTFACNGLLIEESRINLCTYSQDISSADWTKNNINTTGTPPYIDVAVAPDNTQTADKLIENTVSSSHYIDSKNVTVAAGAVTFSMFFKKGERSRVQMYLIDSVGIIAGTSTIFDINAGTILSGAQGTITNYGNSGWYRCSVQGTAAAGNCRCRIVINDSGTTGTSGFYVWGAQLEQGAFPTSYIPNLATGSTTRNADVATMTGTNFSSWWVATNGASDIWLTPKSTSTLAYMSFDDNTANNSIIIANSTTSGQSTITSSGSLQATLTAGTITANATNKVGCSWNTNNCAATANATTPATTVSATIPTVTQLRIGSNGSAYANAWIQKLFYWSQRITNNEIQAFTK